jgi:hypothetical protein
MNFHIPWVLLALCLVYRWLGLFSHYASATAADPHDSDPLTSPSALGSQGAGAIEAASPSPHYSDTVIRVDHQPQAGAQTTTTPLPTTEQKQQSDNSKIILSQLSPSPVEMVSDKMKKIGKLGWAAVQPLLPDAWPVQAKICAWLGGLFLFLLALVQLSWWQHGSSIRSFRLQQKRGEWSMETFMSPHTSRLLQSIQQEASAPQIGAPQRRMKSE